MRQESGFSLVEVVVAIVLLGLVAVGFARLTYGATGKLFYQRNVAVSIAERKIEECRQRASTPITVGATTNTGYQEMGAASINTTTSWATFSSATGNNQVVVLDPDGTHTTKYYVDVQVRGYDIATISQDGTYNLNTSGLLTNVKTTSGASGYDGSQVKQVTVRVYLSDPNNPLVQRVIYINR